MQGPQSFELGFGVHYSVAISGLKADRMIGSSSLYSTHRGFKHYANELQSTFPCRYVL